MLVALLAVFLTAGLFGRWSWTAWSQPHWLEGDPLEIYARVKIAAEQPGGVLLGLDAVAALGAPATADWTGYPVPDRLVFVLAGWLAEPLGLIAAIQLVSAAIFGLNAASFYLCARWLRWRWEWAAALALAFALCTYNLRWGVTLSFSQTFTLPPLVLLCARAARRGSNPGKTWPLLAVVLGLWLAQGNPYLAYFSGVIAGGALLLGLARRVSRARLGLLLLFLSVLAVGFLVVNARQIGHLAGSSEGSPLTRNQGDLTTYSLRPVEWFVPPADHRARPLGEFGRAYFDHRQGHGEFFYNYLGIVGVIAWAGLLVASARRLARRPSRISDALLGLVWITAFGLAGGINTWLGALGLDFFRAATRIGIFAQIWVFLFLGGWLTRQLPNRAMSLGLALVLPCLAIWDQTPPLTDPVARTRNHERWQEYAAVTATLERTLPAGAMVFQLPATAFPESARIGAMPDYEHLLPYLTSHSLRYSYGHLAGTPALRWASHVSRLGPASMAEALEHAGFAALWIDTRAYPDNATSLLQALRAAGRRELPGERQPANVRIFLLTPRTPAVPPDFNDPRYLESWDGTASQPALLALHGWYPLEQRAADRWRWANRHAALGIWSDESRPDAVLRFRIDGPAQSTVVLISAGRELLRASPGPKIHTVRLPLALGLNRLDWSLEGATFRPGDHDPRELGFMVENLSVSAP